MLYFGTSDMYTCIVYETNNAVVLHGIFYHVFVEKTCCEITVRPPSDAAKGRARWILQFSWEKRISMLNFFSVLKKKTILHDIFFYSFRIKTDLIDNMYRYTKEELRKCQFKNATVFRIGFISRFYFYFSSIVYCPASNQDLALPKWLDFYLLVTTGPCYRGNGGERETLLILVSVYHIYAKRYRCSNIGGS